MRLCEICGVRPRTRIFRCEECYRCDDCGGSDHLCSYATGLRCAGCQEKWIAFRRAETDVDLVEHPDLFENVPNEVICPTCQFAYSDGYEYEDGVHRCGECGSLFEVERSVEISFTTCRVDEGSAS